MGKLALAGEMWLFLRQNKKYWLLPILVVLFVVGGLLVFAQSSALAPFIYSFF
jgi:drug/metabolite transporter superfamily protein YnfA